jgi:uncharacterized protein YdeI (YjbR/CyaY-like superfamily)
VTSILGEAMPVAQHDGSAVVDRAVGPTRQTPPMAERTDLPVLTFATAEDFERWLEHEHTTARGIWLRFAKRGSDIVSVTYEQAVLVALCFGWIDGQARSEGEASWLQRFTPRTRRSVWSQLNRQRVGELIAQGRMRPAGLEEIEKAKADGRWDAAYAPPSTAAVPPDLAEALAAAPSAQAVFAGLDSRNRYAILHRIATARRPQTRAARIAKFVKMLENGELLYPP